MLLNSQLRHFPVVTVVTGVISIATSLRCFRPSRDTGLGRQSTVVQRYISTRRNTFSLALSASPSRVFVHTRTTSSQGHCLISGEDPEKMSLNHSDNKNEEVRGDSGADLSGSAPPCFHRAVLTWGKQEKSF